jgi:hypothetical protein
LATATQETSLAPSVPGLQVEDIPAAAALANATFSAHGPPEKWKTLIPVNILPSEARAAQPTVLQTCQYGGYEGETGMVIYWSINLRSGFALGTASMHLLAASIRDFSAELRGMMKAWFHEVQRRRRRDYLKLKKRYLIFLIPIYIGPLFLQFL